MTTTTRTPRTAKVRVGIIGFYSCATVPADFAEKLETENQQIWGVLNSIRVARKLGKNPETFFNEVGALLPRIDEVLSLAD